MICFPFEMEHLMWEQGAIQETARPHPTETEYKPKKDPALSVSTVAVTRQTSCKKPWKSAWSPSEKLSGLLCAHQHSNWHFGANFVLEDS